MKTKVLVLGGTLFIGRVIVSLLLEQQNAFEITLFNRGKSNPDLFGNRVNYIIGDRRDKADLLQLQKYNFDAVIDCSSYFPLALKDLLVNLNRTIKRYVYISTVSVYPKAAVLHTEKDAVLNCTPEQARALSMASYGEKKAACEKVLLEHNFTHKAVPVILRPSIVYGPYDYTDRLYYWLYRIKKNRKVLLPKSDSVFNLTYVYDLANIVIDSLQDIEHKQPAIYNATTHKPITLNKLLHIIASELNSSSKFIVVEPKKLIEQGVKEFKDLPLWSIKSSLQFDNAKLKNTYATNLHSVENSIKQTIAYYDSLQWPIPNAGLTLAQESELIKRFEP